MGQLTAITAVHDLPPGPVTLRIRAEEHLPVGGLAVMAMPLSATLVLSTTHLLPPDISHMPYITLKMPLQ